MSLRLLLHPSDRTLNRYADATLRRSSARRVGAHLLECERCRASVESIRALRLEAESARVPTLSPYTLERVLARRAAGERHILPVSDETVTGRSWRVAQLIAVAAAIVIAVALPMFVSRDATAASDDGELVLAPARPQAGATIRATYTPPTRFANESLLVLRARLVFGPEDAISGVAPVPPATQRLIMTRDRDGRFRQRFVFPASATLARLAVEDLAAERIDTHSRRFWELLAHDAAGRPTFAALHQAASSESGREWDDRYLAAQEAVRAFPDSLAAWRDLAFLERVSRGERTAPARTRHEQALARFDRRARASERVPARVLGELMWYARTLDDSARTRYWRTRLLAEAPRDPLAVQERVIDALHGEREQDSASSHRVLAALERIWQDAGPVHESLLTYGFRTAAHSREPAAIEQWGDRYLASPRHPTWVTSWVASEYVEYGQLRARGLDILRSLLAPRDPVTDPSRSLGQTVTSWRRRATNDRAATLQRIGEALLADGKRVAALDSLRASAALGWDVARFRSLAEAALAAGDTAEAARVLALVALDPTTSPAFADSARRMIGNMRAEQWETVRRSAQADLYTRLMRSAVRRSLRAQEIRLTDPAGKVHHFADVARGRITVVAFGLGFHNGSLVNIASTQRLARRLARWNAQVIAIDHEPWSADVADSVRRRGIDFGVYFDPHHDALRAFNAYGIPMYFVVDAAGDLRFEFSDVDQLLIQASVLAQERRIVRAATRE